MELVDRIMHPLDVLKEYRGQLLKLYSEDYGKSTLPLLKRRSKHICYLFDATPDLTYEFYLQHQKDFSDSHIVDRIVLEYNDYCLKKNELDHENKKQIYSVMCEALAISEDAYYSKLDEIVSLPIESYAFSNMEFVGSSILEHQQEEYIEKCEKLGIHPITDSTLINDILNYKKRVQFICNVILLESTLFGNRILDELKQVNSGVDFTDIAKCLFNEESINLCYHSYGPVITIVHCPFIKDLTRNIVNLDQIFLHENRHAIEGSFSEKFSIYKIFNEIRIDKHAILDNQRMNVIFQKGIPSFSSEYQKLFSYTGDLFEEYGYLFDQYILEGNMGFVEQIFGKKDLLSYVQTLNNTFFTLLMNENFSLSIENNVSDAQEFIKKLKMNALHNGYKPYQKNV